MPIGMAIGQAAGTAAAIMAMTNVGGIEVDAKRLREDLKSAGAYL
jgi:predicted metal-dependent phosphoesterase TrpH